MKTKLTLLLAFVLCSFVLHAQSPQKFNYQAVVRNNTGTPIVSKQIGVKILIHETTATGTTVYEESHTPTTNAFGVFSIQVGTGTVISGVFYDVAWNAENHFVETFIDPTGGTNYKSLGTNELVSVPYALHANTVENDKVDDADADSTNEIQTIIKVGKTVTLSNNGGTFIDEVYDGDSSQTNELQKITKSGTTVTLSNNGGTFTDAVDDADASPTNEIQILGKSGSNIVLSKGGGTVSVDDADASTTNEIQILGKSGSNILLSKGGGSVSVDDADASATNELQTISKSGTTVTLSNNGGSFTDAVDDADASATNELQTISKSGSNLVLSNGGGTVSINDADTSITNEIQTITSNATNLVLSKSGGTVALNDVNYWKKSGNNIYESSRNVGIGTSSPKNALHVSGSKSDTSLALFFNTNTGSGAHALKAMVGASNVQTGGYIGVTSKTGFDNNSEIKFPSSGMEIGMLGVTTGGSGGDNIAIMGHTNGGRAAFFKNSSAKTQVSIGVTNYGIYIDTGALFVQGDAFMNSGLGIKKDAIIDGNLQVKKTAAIDGILGVSQYILHTGDGDTYLSFTADRIATQVGDKTMIDIVEDGNNNSYINLAPAFVNAGFGGVYSDAKLRSYSLRGEDNKYAFIAENARSTDNLTIGTFSKAKNTGSYNQSAYGAYNTSTNSCTGTGSRWSYGSWNYAEVLSSTGTSASYGVVGAISSTDRSDVRFAGYFLGNAYGSNFYTPSDRNLKTNIALSSSSLAKILALPIKTYDYKTTEFAQMSLPEGTQTGIMAQDLETQFPELVTRAIQPPMSEIEKESLTKQGLAIPASANKEVDFKAVNYNGLIPHLTSAIQEQQKIIVTQNTELAALKAELEKQKALLIELQKLLTK